MKDYSSMFPASLKSKDLRGQPETLSFPRTLPGQTKTSLGSGNIFKKCRMFIGLVRGGGHKFTILQSSPGQGKR